MKLRNASTKRHIILCQNVFRINYLHVQEMHTVTHTYRYQAGYLSGKAGKVEWRAAEKNVPAASLFHASTSPSTLSICGVIKAQS